jgi:hypothetical protein
MIINTKEVYQFKITLNNSKPSIWRRIVVPSNYSFWDLHVAIQDSVGWLDYHLSSVLNNPKSEEYADMIEWVGKDFNPEYFDPGAVLFDDPKKRFNRMNEW